jgi:5-methyltetrahydrofolate--homocysteine methyltransferase
MQWADIGTSVRHIRHQRKVHMIVIGEKINGTRKAVAKAILDRDTAFIQGLAKSQVAAGSHYLDVNAGTAPEREPEDMAWLVTTVQAVCDTPLCLDSANPEALKAALDLVSAPPMINSVSGEKPRIEGVLPLPLANIKRT